MSEIVGGGLAIIGTCVADTFGTAGGCGGALVVAADLTATTTTVAAEGSVMCSIMLKAAALVTVPNIAIIVFSAALGIGACYIIYKCVKNSQSDVKYVAKLVDIPSNTNRSRTLSDILHELHKRVWNPRFERTRTQWQTQFGYDLNQKFSIGFMGQVDVGKSALVNALTGRSDNDDVAAKVDIVCCTNAIKPYTFGDRIILWDTPGYGGNFEKPLRPHELQQFNHVLVVTNNSFTKADEDVCNCCLEYGIPFSVICNKADIAASEIHSRTPKVSYLEVKELVRSKITKNYKQGRFSRIFPDKRMLFLTSAKHYLNYLNALKMKKASKDEEDCALDLARQQLFDELDLIKCIGQASRESARR